MFVSGEGKGQVVGMDGMITRLKGEKRKTKKKGILWRVIPDTCMSRGVLDDSMK